jgi:hypothetical protein
VDEWLGGAWGRLDGLLGQLSVPDDPYVPEMMGRYAMVADDAFLFDGDGRIRHPRGGSWVLMGMIAPGYLSALIPDGDLGVSCPPPSATVSWSLYGTTLLPLVAGEVYQWSGATDAFAAGGVFEEQYRCLVDAIVATRYADVALFPSTYVWDGPSRGDYHTGSNIAVWYVLQAGARFADEVWGDPVTATEWSSLADEVRAAILDRAVADTWFDEQFLEGGFADGRVDAEATCHDGEEIMVATAPIFDFVESDDPRRIRHGVSAMSTVNGFYEPSLDAMYWAEGAPVTAPGWLPALSGAADEAAIEAAIALWRSRTDVDGSIYWWPYDDPSTDPYAIRRRLSFGGATPIDTPKVDYATSNVLALLIHDVFGLSGDVPAREVRFRPHTPWSSFTWRDAPMGTAGFDLSYVDDGATIVATLTNREPDPWVATVEVTVPTGSVATSEPPSGTRYTRDALARTATLGPGESLTVTLSSGAGPGDACVEGLWDDLAARTEALGDWQETLLADGDDDDIPEGWALRLLAAARCADPAVEAAWQANEARCATLGWGSDLSTLCASYATLSSDAEALVRGWNGRDLGLTPFRDGAEEPLSSSGDLDADGATNRDEFLDRGGASGSREAYASAATGGL